MWAYLYRKKIVFRIHHFLEWNKFYQDWGRKKNNRKMGKCYKSVNYKNQARITYLRRKRTIHQARRNVREVSLERIQAATRSYRSWGTNLPNGGAEG